MRIGHRNNTQGREASFFQQWTADNAAHASHAVPVAAGSGPEVESARRPRRHGPALAGVIAVAVGASMLIPTTNASADPSSHTWYRLRMCESSNNYSINTGNNHYGAYQFDLSTWESVGGSGYPNKASKAEQDARALILYRKRGWQPWQCAGILGLHEDSDAGSGYTGDIKISKGGSTSSPKPSHSTNGVPDFPGGSHQYFYGEWNSSIKTFQNQMHKRGYFPAGTGQYGPKTLTMVKQLQRLNGLPPRGYIGPKTWKLAWKGKYHQPTASLSTPSTPSGSTGSAAPAFPGGSHQYFYGERNSSIKTFQNQMHKRGYFPAGTGQYGPKTLRMVKQLQQLNGLAPRGYIGPKTWKLAWTGKYHRP